MSDKIPFTALVRELPASVPFVGPEALERQRGRSLKVRIGANESAFGISAKAAQAMRAEIDRVAWYADPEGHELKTEIAARFSINLHEVCLGGGVDELLGLVVRMIVEPGTPVVSSLGLIPRSTTMWPVLAGTCTKCRISMITSTSNVWRIPSSH